MQEKQFLIPDKIKVGFQNRNDTYTKKLAYVIYYDQKGKLRKEKSWESWIDKKIKPIDLDNVPTEGFVLNKKVGGYKSNWNYRDSHVRVYDPRDFEFEISVPNLLYILTQCDCSKGKGLEGKFVYAWDRTELVLLPENSEDYKNSINFTNLQARKIKVKDLIPGASYQTKKQKIYIYLGKFIQHCICDNYETTSPKYVFLNGNEFVFLTSLTSIAILHSDVVVPNYAELVDKYNKSPWGSKPVALFTKNCTSNYWVHEEFPGIYMQFETSYQSVIRLGRFQIKNGVLLYDRCYEYINKYNGRICPKPTGVELWVELESGSKFKVLPYSLIED